MSAELDNPPLEPAPMWGIGTIIGEKYRILRPLGAGGMGAVFEVENTVTLKRAAIKLLHPEHVSRGAGQLRLLREARATSKIRHRNVVDVYDVVLQGSTVVLVMELLKGELLPDYVKRSALEVFEFVKLLLPVMEGIDAAHHACVIHRDVKPENIFLVAGHGGEQIPKLIDFGISKTAEPDGAALTQSGTTIGTPRYISHEQLHDPRSVDGRADVYAVGVMLYEALVGRAPYRASNLAEQALQFLTSVPIAPHVLRPAVPERLSCLVGRAIERDRAARFGSMREMIEALRPFADSSAYPEALSIGVDAGQLGQGHAELAANTRPYSDAAVARPSAPTRGSPRWLWLALLLLTLGFGLLKANPLPRAPTAISAMNPQQNDMPAEEKPAAAEPPHLVEAVPEPSVPPEHDARPAKKKRTRGLPSSTPLTSAPVQAAERLTEKEELDTQVTASDANRAGPVRREEF